MNHFLRNTLLVALACASVSPLAAQQDAETTSTKAFQTHPAWGIVAAEIPQILRVHCPVLRGGIGLLVQSCDPDSVAGRLGIDAGDVVLDINGKRVSQAKPLPAIEPMAMVTVLRNGQPQMLMPAQMPQGFLGLASPSPPWQMPPARTSGVTASSFASGNQAVSVSRLGDQISLEMSIPQLSRLPIRFSGTASQIQDQLQKSPLSEDAKQAVRRAIGE